MPFALAVPIIKGSDTQTCASSKIPTRGLRRNPNLPLNDLTPAQTANPWITRHVCRIVSNCIILGQVFKVISGILGVQGVPH